jgi:hypothetical protein
MRVLRSVGVLYILAAVVATAWLGVSGGPVADAASGDSRPADGANRIFGVAGTITYSAHGSDTLIAGTTVPPGPDGGCSESTSSLSSSTSYTFTGRYSGQLPGVPHTKLSAKLLGLAGTSGCNNTGQTGTSFACTATPTHFDDERAEVSGGMVMLSLDTRIQTGPERRVDAEPCFSDSEPVPLLPNNDYLEVGGTFAFPLSQIEKTRRISVTLDSQKAVNCLEDGMLVLPARTKVCVDSTNAKNARCDVFAVPVGGSATCAITNDWVEKVRFNLSQVCALQAAARATESPLAPTCVTGTNVLGSASNQTRPNRR